MILITASTGHLGQLVLDQLATTVDPSTVVATSRRPEALADRAAQGFVVRELDYDRPDTFAAALEGVTQVLLISGSELGKRVAQHQAVIDAAAAAGVRHVAYTSVLRADTSTVPVAPEHLATEQALAAASFTTTLLRHGWYLENYTEQLAPALANGAFVGSAGTGRIAAAARADYAAADVAALLDPSLHGGTFELAGTAFTMADLAAAVSARAGRELPYVDLPVDDYAGILAGAGLPPEIAHFLAHADVSISQGELDGSSDTLERLIGRAPTSLEAALDQLSWS